MTILDTDFLQREFDHNKVCCTMSVSSIQFFAVVCCCFLFCCFFICSSWDIKIQELTICLFVCLYRFAFKFDLLYPCLQLGSTISFLLDLCVTVGCWAQLYEQYLLVVKHYNYMSSARLSVCLYFHLPILIVLNFSFYVHIWWNCLL